MEECLCCSFCLRNILCLDQQIFVQGMNTILIPIWMSQVFDVYDKLLISYIIFNYKNELKSSPQSHQRPLRRLNTQNLTHYWNDFSHHPVYIIGMIRLSNCRGEYFPFSWSQDIDLFRLLLKILFLEITMKSLQMPILYK